MRAIASGLRSRLSVRATSMSNHPAFSISRPLLAWAAATALLVQPRAQAQAAPSFVLAWGSAGIAAGQFDRIAGIAVDPAGFVYVADSDLKRIQKFTPDGAYVLQWGYGSADVTRPVGLAADSHGHVFVTDYFGHHVLRYDTQGTFQTAWGDFGPEQGQFEYPTDVEVERDGNVLVVDQFNSRLQRFTPDGVFVAQIGDSAGSSDGLLYYPFGVAIDLDGNIYVSDENNHRVQKFDHDGHFITKWGSVGTGAGEFTPPGSPTGIAVDPDRTLYVVDTFSNRVEIFGDAGAYKGEFGGPGSDGGLFSFPVNIAVGADFTIYVGDRDNHRVQKFTARHAETLELSESVPNPAQSAATITFTLPQAAYARLSVFDLEGRRIATLVSGALEAGRHSVRWDGTDDHGRKAPSGVYLYRLEAAGRAQSKRLMLVK